MKKSIKSKKLLVTNKYSFYPDYAHSDIDYSELVTVPDQVLSMYDIYMKYAVRGEVAGLANNVRPHVSDDLDLDDPEVDVQYDDDLDVMQRAKMLRSRQQDQSYPATEDKPQSSRKAEPSPKPQYNAGSGEVSSDSPQAAEQPDSSKDIE